MQLTSTSNSISLIAHTKDAIERVYSLAPRRCSSDKTGDDAQRALTSSARAFSSSCASGGASASWPTSHASCRCQRRCKTRCKKAVAPRSASPYLGLGAKSSLRNSVGNLYLKVGAVDLILSLINHLMSLQGDHPSATNTTRLK